MGIRGELFSLKLVCEERTYFFNVKENRLGDVFLSVVESKESELSSYERHSIVVFQENLDEFMSQLTKIANDMKKIKPARLADKLEARSREAKDGDSRNHTNGQTRQSRSGVRISGMAARNPTGSEKRVVRSRPTGARNAETSSRDTKSPAPRKRPVVRAKRPADKDSSQP